MHSEAMMNSAYSRPDMLAAYYWLYVGVCGVLILGLGSILHRTGRDFLEDSLAGNRALVSAIGRLLDIGFYLVSAGYVALTYQTNWPVPDLGTALKIAIIKLGGLLLLLGVSHLFNLLLLAIFRDRRTIKAQS
jgi:hypothetical protein